MDGWIGDGGRGGMGKEERLYVVQVKVQGGGGFVGRNGICLDSFVCVC